MRDFPVVEDCIKNARRLSAAIRAAAKIDATTQELLNPSMRQLNELIQLRELLSVDLKRMMRNSLISNPPDVNVPLYSSQSTNLCHVNGQDLQNAEEVNIRSLVAMTDCSQFGITGLTKTCSVMKKATSIEFATDVTSFGTIGMTRHTISPDLLWHIIHEVLPMTN